MNTVRRWLPWACPALAAVFAFRRLDNTDTWWHLASGRWIAEHGAVQTTDPFSFTVPGAEWTNTQWLFDLLLFVLHRLGGADALVMLSVAVHTAVVALAIGLARRRMGPLATTAFGLWVVFVCQPRFAIRPEMFSFLLLLVLLWILLDSNGARGRRVFLLVPLMALWANLHSLFAVGLFVIGCAVASTMIDAWRCPPRSRGSGALARRRLYAAAGLSTAATLVNPYFIEGALFPLALISRFDKASAYRAIGEFRGPFQSWFATWSMGAFQIGFLLCAAVVAIGVALSIRSRAEDGEQRDYGMSFQILLFVGLAVPALMARRNIPLLVLGTVPVVSRSLAAVGSRVFRGPVRPALMDAAAVALIFGLGLAGWSAASNHYYRLDDKSHETGAGVLEYRFPVRAAAFFERMRLPGPHYNDLSAGGYLTWADPAGQGVFIDGRLEVYDEFFEEYLRGLREPAVWFRQADQWGVQSAILFHAYRNRHPLIRQLRVSEDWKLVYVDEVVVIFVRTRGNEETIAGAAAAFESELAEIERGLLAAPGVRGYPHAQVRATANFARALDVIGQRDRAVRFFERCLESDLDRRERHLYTLWLGSYHFLKGDRDRARRFLLQAAEADPGDAKARAMLEKLDAR